MGHGAEVFPRLHLFQRGHNVHQEGAAERSAKGESGGETQSARAVSATDLDHPG